MTTTPFRSILDAADVHSFHSEAIGFSVTPTPQSKRLFQVDIHKEVVDAFLVATQQWPLQALEYKSFMRFRVAQVLDDLCSNTLKPFLVNTLVDRNTGGVIVNPEGLDQVADAENMVKFSTAIAHLIGRSNFDAMGGQYYARFVVENVDNSDSYLRKADRRMELHNDGTYVEEVTDFVLMMKLDEQNMSGGDSLLLHLDDWDDLETYFKHPLACRVMRWAAPPSKNVGKDVFHAVFDVDVEGRPIMSYIDQFVQPKDFYEGTWLADMSDSIEGCENTLAIPVPTGSLLLINNHFWLHGRDKFTSHPGLRRELMRQRGYFTEAQTLRHG